MVVPSCGASCTQALWASASVRIALASDGIPMWIKCGQLVDSPWTELGKTCGFRVGKMWTASGSLQVGDSLALWANCAHGGENPLCINRFWVRRVRVRTWATAHACRVAASLVYACFVHPGPVEREKMLCGKGKAGSPGDGSTAPGDRRTRSGGPRRRPCDAVEGRLPSGCGPAAAPGAAGPVSSSGRLRQRRAAPDEWRRLRRDRMRASALAAVSGPLVRVGGAARSPGRRFPALDRSQRSRRRPVPHIEGGRRPPATPSSCSTRYCRARCLIRDVSS